MIEALVAIVVMSLGLLAVVGVQLEALRGNMDASQSAVAASLVRDYQEALTAIPSLAAKTTTDKITAVDKGSYTSYGTATECKGATANCSNTQFADFQTREWIDRASKALPGGKVTVCFDNAYRETSGSSAGLYKWDCSNTGVLVVKIGWNSKPARAGGSILETGITDGTDRPRLVMPVTGSPAGAAL